MLIPKEFTVDYYIESKTDLLTLSCCMHRLNLFNVTTDDVVEEQDKIKAFKIRKYYQSKLLLLTLKGVEFTEFRKNLSDFLNKDFYSVEQETYLYDKDYRGLAYRLPEFYEYDLSLEEIAGSPYNKINGAHEFDGIKQLNFIKKLTVKNRKTNQFEYWFSDQKNNLVVIPVEVKNPLDNLFYRMVTRGPVPIKAQYTMRHRNNIQFYKTYVWELVDL